MKRFRTSRTALPLLAALLLLLSACGAGGAPSGGSGGQAQQAEQTEQPSDSSSGAETLADLCGADYQAYLVETITMQMGNRMDKDPEVVYFPIAEDAPLTDVMQEVNGLLCEDRTPKVPAEKLKEIFGAPVFA